MKNRLTKIMAGAFIAVLLLSSGLMIQATAVAQDTAAADPMQFARGAQAWANNCSRCHNMRDPKELRDDQWRAAVGHMRVRAGLTGQEARDILAFLQGSN